jgi:hypothetical protein
VIGIPLIHLFAQLTLILLFVRGIIFLWPTTFIGRGLTVLYG